MKQRSPSTSRTKRAGRQTLGELRQLQRLAADVIMRPLDERWRTDRRWEDGRLTADVVAPMIKPNSRLSSMERIELYNRQYWFRVIDALYEDFPGLLAVLGRRAFNRVIKAYLAEWPSRSFTLRNLGDRLPEFISDHPKLTAPHTVLAYDMARLEWAQTVAFDGPERAPVQPQAIAKVNPNRLRLNLQPHLSLLELSYPVHNVKASMKNRTVRSEASNATEDVVHATRSPRPMRPRKRRTYLAVHRHQNRVYFKQLSQVEYAVLTALAQGQTLANACIEATRVVAQPPQEGIGGAVHSLFTNGSKLGWFCPVRET